MMDTYWLDSILLYKFRLGQVMQGIE